MTQRKRKKQVLLEICKASPLKKKGRSRRVRWWSWWRYQENQEGSTMVLSPSVAGLMGTTELLVPRGQEVENGIYLSPLCQWKPPVPVPAQSCDV